MENTVQENKLRELMLRRQKDKNDCADYSYFFKRAWYELEPTTPLIQNWHINLLCDELQQQAERIHLRKKKEYDIVVNIPPRSIKSTIFSRLLIPWAWTRYPNQRFLTASFSKDLALEHAVDSRSVILTPWYQRYWGEVYRMQGDQNVKSFYRTDKSGYRMAVSVGSSAIGKGANWEIFDDPNDPKDISEVKLQTVINWFLKVMYSRLNNQDVDLRVIVQQRTNEQDLTGFLLQNYPTAYKLFCFPGEESDHVSPPEVKKYYKNGLFFPERFSRSILEGYKKNLRGDYAGQIQQTPAPEEGNMFKRTWWRFWRPKDSNLPDVVIKVGDEVFHAPTVDIPDKFEDKILSWDMGLKGKKENDPSCGDVYARTHVDYFLIDEARGKWDDLQNEIEVQAQKRKHPDTSIILIEDAAAGVVVIRRLKIIMPGILEENPSEKGPKKTRAKPFAALAQTGNIYLPHPSIAPWIWDWIDEVCVFDRGTHDERIDCGSQAINHFIKTKRVFSEYNGETSPFKVGWDRLSPDWKIYASMYVDRIMRTSILVIIWNSRTGMLRVIAEYYSDIPNPEIVVPAMRLIVRTIGAEKVDKNRLHWIGNDIIFSKGQGNIADSYIRSKDNRVYIRPVKNYNEAGAINAINRLISANQLVIHDRSDLLKQEMLSWAYKNQENPLPDKDGYVLARALCQVTAVIKEIPNSTQKQPPSRIYTPERTRILEALDRLASSGELDREYSMRSNNG